MKSERKASIIVGALFIITTFTFAIGDGIIQEMTMTENFLKNIPDDLPRFIIAITFQLICGLGVIGIAVVLYPIFKKFSERIAIWYVGIRVMECTIIAISGLNLLTLLELGKNDVKENIADIEYFQILESSLSASYHAAFVILALVLSFGAFAFYYLLFKSKLIPRFIPVWSILAVLSMMTGLFIDMLGYKPNLLLYIPMGANELFLGVWLIVRGFNQKCFTAKAES